MERTGTTVLDGELNLNHVVRLSVDSRGPAQTGMTGWTSGPLLLPIELEILSREALCGSPLPAIVSACWPVQVKVVVPLALEEPGSGDIARIDQVPTGK